MQTIKYKSELFRDCSLAPCENSGLENRFISMVSCFSVTQKYFMHRTSDSVYCCGITMNEVSRRRMTEAMIVRLATSVSEELALL